MKKILVGLVISLVILSGNFLKPGGLKAIECWNELEAGITARGVPVFGIELVSYKWDEVNKRAYISVKAGYSKRDYEHRPDPCGAPCGCWHAWIKKDACIEFKIGWPDGTETDWECRSNFSGTIEEGESITICAQIKTIAANPCIINHFIKSITLTAVPPTCETVGDPVGVAVGNMLLDEEDISIKGSLPLRFRRSYNSTNTHDGPLGYGWTHDYDMRLLFSNDAGDFPTVRKGMYGAHFLVLVPSGDVPAHPHRASPTDFVIVKRGDGKKWLFLEEGSSYTPSPSSGVTATLTKNQGSPVTYTLREKNGTEYEFNETGKLALVKDRHDNQLTLTYTGDFLTRVEDDSGRAIEFTYDANGRISSARRVKTGQ